MADSAFITRRSALVGAFSSLLLPSAALALPMVSNEFQHLSLSAVDDAEINRAYFAYLQNERRTLARQMYGIGPHVDAMSFTPVNTGFDLMVNRIGWDELIDAKSRARRMLQALGCEPSDFY